MPDRWKRAAAEAAVALVEDGMTLGLGTGSTAAAALEALAGRLRAGLKIAGGVPTSDRTAEQARRLGIPLTDFARHQELDLTIDGADEIERSGLALIKGGGGALLREKIVAAASRRLVIVADDTKLVDRLGRFRLPVETVPFGWEVTARRLGSARCPGRAAPRRRRHALPDRQRPFRPRLRLRQHRRPRRARADHPPDHRRRRLRPLHRPRYRGDRRRPWRDAAPRPNLTGGRTASGCRHLTRKPAPWPPRSSRPSTSAPSGCRTGSSSRRCASTVPTTARATDWHLQHLDAARLSPAPAWSIVEATAVERHGRITHGDLGLYNDANEAALGRVLAAAGASPRRHPLGVQLAHAGRKASTERPWEGGGPLGPARTLVTVAPSAIPFAAGWHTPQALTRPASPASATPSSRPPARAVRLGLDVDRAARRARLPAARVLLAARQPAHRPLRRQPRQPHALPARDPGGRPRRGPAHHGRSACASPAPTGPRTAGRSRTPSRSRRAVKERGVGLRLRLERRHRPARRIPVGPGYQVPLRRAACARRPAWRPGPSA